jgi:hypothetical protein
MTELSLCILHPGFPVTLLPFISGSLACTALVLEDVEPLWTSP